MKSSVVLYEYSVLVKHLDQLLGFWNVKHIKYNLRHYFGSYGRLKVVIKKKCIKILETKSLEDWSGDIKKDFKG